MVWGLASFTNVATISISIINKTETMNYENYITRKRTLKKMNENYLGKYCKT